MMYSRYANKLQSVTKEPDSVTMDLFQTIQKMNKGKNLDDIFNEYRATNDKEKYAVSVAGQFHYTRFLCLMDIMLEERKRELHPIKDFNIL